MHLTATAPYQLTTGSNHHAFTSCATWRGMWYVAYRTARTHHITPPGVIALQHSADMKHWSRQATLTMGIPIDLRDPRLIPSHEALYCLCAAYTPRWPRTTLSQASPDNIIQSYITYTEDGKTWADLQPVGRPGYWIWSVVPTERYWVAAAYHTGSYGETSSLHLLSGTSLLTLMPHGLMYDGADITRDGHHYRYEHSTVSEPVLYQPSPGALACCARTEGGSETMEIGVSRHPYQRWHWWDTKKKIHPSAVIETEYGWLLAGRETYKPITGDARNWNTSASLFQLDAQKVTQLMRLPSALDTAYPGLCEGTKPGEYLCSYYSQHQGIGRFGKALPGAHVYTTILTVSHE